MLWKYENVDIVSMLGSIMMIYTKRYKDDFLVDIGKFMQAAEQPNDENTRLLWLSRPNGTDCFQEREVYIRQTFASHKWMYYADTDDMLAAYAVEVTGIDEHGNPKGNLHELDYRPHVAQLRRKVVTATAVTLRLPDGEEKRLSTREYHANWAEVTAQECDTRVRYEVEDEPALQELLRQVRDERQRHDIPALFNAETIFPATDIQTVRNMIMKRES